MLITRETDYAIRTIRALACKKVLTIKHICDREQIPLQFTYKILKKLSKANIIRIIRGASGGYELSADLHQISLYDLVIAVNGDLALNACNRPDYECPWQAAHGGELCHVHRELSRVQDVLTGELKRHSLYQILYEE